MPRVSGSKAIVVLSSLKLNIALAFVLWVAFRESEITKQLANSVIDGIQTDPQVQVEARSEFGANAFLMWAGVTNAILACYQLRHVISDIPDLQLRLKSVVAATACLFFDISVGEMWSHICPDGWVQERMIYAICLLDFAQLSVICQMFIALGNQLGADANRQPVLEEVLEESERERLCGNRIRPVDV